MRQIGTGISHLEIRGSGGVPIEYPKILRRRASAALTIHREYLWRWGVGARLVGDFTTSELLTAKQAAL